MTKTELTILFTLVGTIFIFAATTMLLAGAIYDKVNLLLKGKKEDDSGRG